MSTNIHHRSLFQSAFDPASLAEANGGIDGTFESHIAEFTSALGLRCKSEKPVG
jgi:hypothetical protein